MRNAPLLVFVLVLVVGLVAGAIGGQALTAQQQPITRTLLLKTENPSGIEGMEAYVTLVEIAPGAQSGKHYHLGTDFMYILDGSGILEMEGQSPVLLKQGQVFPTRPKLVHYFRNASATAPVKILGFQVVKNGEALVIPVQ
jgi:quercetin dioxygenase-like cupin family protein